MIRSMVVYWRPKVTISDQLPVSPSLLPRSHPPINLPTDRSGGRDVGADKICSGGSLINPYVWRRPIASCYSFDPPNLLCVSSSISFLVSRIFLPFRGTFAPFLVSGGFPFDKAFLVERCSEKGRPPPGFLKRVPRTIRYRQWIATPSKSFPSPIPPSPLRLPPAYGALSRFSKMGRTEVFLRGLVSCFPPLEVILAVVDDSV